jgi:guanylate kinase
LTKRDIFIIFRRLEVRSLTHTSPLYPFEMVAAVGPSGAGKTTITQYVQEKLGIPRIPSCTTRASQSRDLPGYYRHLELEDFLARRARGEFLESAQYGGSR